jgi:radical SAM superfamily enzyme YgiQ (UPF0313 family)
MVAEIKPEVVAYSSNVATFRRICEEHKKARHSNNYIAILGGPTATFSPETFSESGMDVYCRGEGDLPFKEFLECVEEDKPYDKVLNLITDKGENEVRELIKDLDSLPMPDRHLTIANSHLKNTPKKTFYSTRGCPFACTYCANNVYHELYKGKGNRVRRFSVERLLEEIETIKQSYRMDFVKFGDDCFALVVDDWLREFSQKYPKRVGIPFNCFLRIDTVSEEMLALLKEAGCFSVHLSVDSTSPLVREKILGRNFRNIDIEKTLRLIHSYGIATWVNFMLAAPESTLEDDLGTIKLCKAGKVTYPAFSTTVPMRGTELYRYCIDHGIIDESSDSDMSGCSQRSELNCFSKKEKDIRYNIYLLGAIIAKLPIPFYNLAMLLIRVIPPNRLFVNLRKKMYGYYIENKIFRLRHQQK